MDGRYDHYEGNPGEKGYIVRISTPEEEYRGVARNQLLCRCKTGEVAAALILSEISMKVLLCCKVSVQVDLVNGDLRWQTGPSEENT
jgi:hypothetical protein